MFVSNADWNAFKALLLAQLSTINARLNQMSTLQDLSTVAAQLTAQNQTLATDVQALTTAANGVIAAYEALKTAGLPPAQQAVLDAAVAGLQTALTQETAADTSIKATTASLTGA